MNLRFLKVLNQPNSCLLLKELTCNRTYLVHHLLCHLRSEGQQYNRHVWPFAYISQVTLRTQFLTLHTKVTP